LHFNIYKVKKLEILFVEKGEIVFMFVGIEVFLTSPPGPLSIMERGNRGMGESSLQCPI